MKIKSYYLLNILEAGGSRLVSGYWEEHFLKFQMTIVGLSPFRALSASTESLQESVWRLNCSMAARVSVEAAAAPEMLLLEAWLDMVVLAAGDLTGAASLDPL